MFKRYFIIISLILVSCMGSLAKKTVYMTYILHGNMNYDRYVRPTIWEKFPKIYDSLLSFMDENPDFKGQLQFSGQTLGSLLQAAPDVVEHAKRIHQRGQLNFTGTFYSEPVNVNMDGETNFRCAWLGTKIVERHVGETDGFYLQERAYHAQLPWIFNHSNVTWTPIITGDDTHFPFQLKGMDGSASICLPVTRDDFLKDIKKLPNNALITIEEDYEIPSTFTKAYERVKKFNESQKDIQIKWITAKEYLHKFGTKPAQYVDHGAKASHKRNGTYSRWTADPLDIIVQNTTNQAMADMRSAKIVNALTNYLFNVNLDEPFDSTYYTLKHDPLVWNIERADLYPDIEPQFLARNGKVTQLSKAEHLLLWAVNSDAKGWYPLYEKRRERINSFQNSSLLSRAIIQKGMQKLAEQINLPNGYDKYFLLLNLEQERCQNIQIQAPYPCQLFDLASGQAISTQNVCQGNQCQVSGNCTLPAYGYTVIAAKKLEQARQPQWTKGNSIQQGNISLEANDAHITLHVDGEKTDICLDSFQIKALAEMHDGDGNTGWRQAQAYGSVRTSVLLDEERPQLRVEYQPDWLVHAQLTFTIQRGQVVCDVDFDIPHPTLIRKEVNDIKVCFDPDGLTLLFRPEKSRKIKIGYDLPYGNAEFTKPGRNYFCPLSSLWAESEAQDQGSLLIAPQTGEQAFSADLNTGEVALYMGASTTSGPIKDVRLDVKSVSDVYHEPAWYAEPFHGTYHHQIVLLPYKGTWQDAHIPAKIQAIKTPVYIEEIQQNANAYGIPVQSSIVEINEPNVYITTMDTDENGFFIRLNETEGKETQTEVKLKANFIEKQQIFKNSMKPYGIETVRK